MSVIRKAGTLLSVAALAWGTVAQGEVKRPATGKQPSTTSQPATKPTTQPATAPGAIPKNIFKKITDLTDLDNARGAKSQTELVKILKERMTEVIELSQKTLQLYPTAANLPALQFEMMRAAHFLAVSGNDEEYRKLTLKLADAILASNATSERRFAADLIKFNSQIRDAVAVSMEEAYNLIVAFADKYRGTDMGPIAISYAHGYADQFGLAVAGEFIDELRIKHGKHPFVKYHFARMGVRPSPLGKPFKAKLTRLDGKELNLPDDLRGKIVVVDFWASWCVPCLRQLPNMQRLYATYRDKDVEFVGISLDFSRGDLTSLLSRISLPWPQTFTGKGYGDPTARRYRINSIPNVWLIDRDGKVITDNAYGRLEKLLAQVVNASPATKPAAAATVK